MLRVAQQLVDVNASALLGRLYRAAEPWIEPPSIRPEPPLPKEAIDWRRSGALRLADFALDDVLGAAGANVAGVMGSKASGVTASTGRIWLESAMFSPASVRTTARSVGLRTDASARFEKGLPREMTLACSVRALELLKQLFPCEAKGLWVCGETSGDADAVLLRRDSLHQLLGPLEGAAGSSDLSDDVIEQCLTSAFR